MVSRKSATPSRPAKPRASPVGPSFAKPRQKPPQPTKSCGTCAHFARNAVNPDKPDLVEGACRCHSIRLTMAGGGAFPPTRGDLWCGEWRA